MSNDYAGGANATENLGDAANDGAGDLAELGDAGTETGDQLNGDGLAKGAEKATNLPGPQIRTTNPPNVPIKITFKMPKQVSFLPKVSLSKPRQLLVKQKPLVLWQKFKQHLIKSRLPTQSWR